MAITYITGIPRSGKSYYAMYLLYKHFIAEKPKPTKFETLLAPYLPKKKLDKEYTFAYTNINQFDFSKSPKIKPYDFNEVQQKLVILHGMYLAKKTDDELIVHAKAVGLFNVLFVIDEAQNFFAKENVVSSWWFTYHGHLHQDIILITQNLDYIFSNYAKTAEFFYKAVPPSSRFFSNKFRYVQFNSYKLYGKDKIGDFHVPMIPDIFKLYVSGASNNAPSQVKKYLFYAVILVVIFFFAFRQFLSLFDTSAPDTNTTKADTNQTAQSAVPPAQTPYDLPQHKKKPDASQKVERDTTHDSLFEIRCVDMICTYKDTDFPKPLFNKLTQKLAPEFIWFFQSANYTQYFVMLPIDTFDFLQIGEKENDKTNTKESKNSKPNAITAITAHK